MTVTHCNGIYAARAYGRGETLTYYGGEDLGKAGTEAGDKAMREARGGEAGRYILKLGGRYIKPDLKATNPAHMLNDAGHKHANAECKGGEVKAKRRIGAGEEIFWCYGVEYWAYWGTRLAGGRLKLPETAKTATETTGRGRGRGRGGTSGGTGGKEQSGRSARGGQGQAGASGDGAGTTGTARVLRQRVNGRAVPADGVT